MKDIIILNVRFQITRYQNKSFDYKNLNSYYVIRKINNITYKLKLFITITKIFSIFYSWLLYFNNDISLRNQKTTTSKSIKSKKNE